MLRGQNGHILKPATKAILGEREIAFYENLQTSRDPTIVQLKNFVPRYYGTTELKVFNKRKAFSSLTVEARLVFVTLIDTLIKRYKNILM